MPKKQRHIPGRRRGQTKDVPEQYIVTPLNAISKRTAYFGGTREQLGKLEEYLQAHGAEDIFWDARFDTKEPLLYATFDSSAYQQVRNRAYYYGARVHIR